MSVVGNDFEKLKKFNLAEIFEPTPLPTPKAEPEPKNEGQ
jgi:tRNA acetyltransferase TAN1